MGAKYRTVFLAPVAVMETVKMVGRSRFLEMVFADVRLLPFMGAGHWTKSRNYRLNLLFLGHEIIVYGVSSGH